MIFKCKPGGPNDYVFLYTSSQEMWQTLWATIGRPEIAHDDRFSDRAKRKENYAALRQVIEDWSGSYTKQEVMRMLGGAGVPCGAVLDSVELLEDPHMCERGMIVTIDHPVRGKVTMPGCPVRLEDSPVEVTSAPLLGEHSRGIYRDMLGYSDGDLDELKRQGVI